MMCSSNPSSINLSFCGCGFLGVYHIGVICAFKEHTPKVLENQMAGCSAGALAAACAMSGCCLGQMCSDALEIAIRARSRALGPLHPTFNIVDIIRNGLRRILPPNAHQICSGRLFISLTRWKDNKNVIINQFNTREELIQVLICSSFVPYWSGVIPHKFRGEYYWDGGLTNNNPIIDEGTILVSPFAGESDICPRDESGSFYSVNFRGTDVSCTQENLYRMTHALFPPNLSALKQICWRGYIDGLKFLQIRNMVKSSVSPKTTISSLLGSDYTEPANGDEEQLGNGGIGDDVEDMFEHLEDVEEEFIDDEDENSCQSDDKSNADGSQEIYSHFCEKVTRKKELPTPLFAVFADARQKTEEPIGRYFTGSKVYKVCSFVALPVTLPIDFTYAMTKRVLNVFRPLPPTHESTASHRAMHYVCSYFGDENAEKYCYHVNDCECTGSRPSSVAASSRRHHRRRRHHPSSRLNHHPLQRQTSVVMSTGTSYHSDSPSDDEDRSTLNHDDAKYLAPVEILNRNLPPPDLIASIKSSNLNKEHCHHLQQMPDLSNEQSSPTTMPFFGKDDHLMNTECNALPTTTLEKNILFN